MKKVLITILSILTLVCCSLFFACSNTDATLIDFTDKTVKVELGGRYTLESSVYDTQGNVYALTSTVTDSDGEEVATDNGGFNVVKDKYEIVYDVVFGKDDLSKKVTVESVEKPVVTVDRKEVSLTLGFLPYEVPEVTADEGTTVVKEIYYKGADGVVKTDYNGTDATFQPDKAGDYFLKLTVTDQNGAVSQMEINFYVTESSGNINYTVNEYGASTLLQGGTSAGTFVAKEDLPTQGVNNDYGYKGAAYKVTDPGSGKLFYAKLEYTATEVEKVIAKQYDSVRFSIMFESQSTASMTSRAESNGVEYNGLMTLVGYKDQPDGFGRTLPYNEWLTYEISTADLVIAMRDQDYDEKTAFIGMFIGNATYNLYFGDMEFFNAGKPTYNFIAQKKNEMNYYYGTSTKTYAKFCSKTAWSTGFNNDAGYTGDAIKFTEIKSGKLHFIKMNYTSKEIQTYMTGKYDKVRFSFMVEIVGASYVQNKAAGYNGMLTRVGFDDTSNGGFGRQFTDKKWVTYEMSLADFIACMSEGDEDDYTVFLGRIDSGGGTQTFNFYMGNIEFINSTQS